MKCIQAIRTGKYSEVGDIKRVDDIDAQEKVTSGYWKFIPKSEWKLATRKPKEVVVEHINDQITDSVTISEKQLKRKKNSK
jgi:hypothetical protein